MKKAAKQTRQTKKATAGKGAPKMTVAERNQRLAELEAQNAARAEAEAKEKERGEWEVIRKFVVEASAHKHKAARIVELVLERFQKAITINQVYDIRHNHQAEIQSRMRVLFREMKLYSPLEFAAMFQQKALELYMEDDLEGAFYWVRRVMDLTKDAGPMSEEAKAHAAIRQFIELEHGKGRTATPEIAARALALHVPGIADHVQTFVSIDGRQTSH